MAPPPTPLERLRRSGIRPDRTLGQNFLIDPNILNVTERTAGLSPEDVVLEVGPGLGVLTERLLDRCAVVHCLEMDRRLAGLLESEFGGQPGFRLYVGDAMRMPLDRLDPAPDKFVANLPYNVAAPLIMKSLAELPGLEFWCLMLQKEIADRLFAAVGTPAYGGLSVMMQLLTEKVSSRPISASVFYPRPRVRSTLLAFRRRQLDATRSYAAAQPGTVKEVVYAGFSHRRKMLANSLAEATPPPGLLAAVPFSERRATAARAIERLGLAPNIRPQALTPEDFERLTEVLAEYAGSEEPQ
jgi:16S rRNA (adenine1518-N6/adenine1519-N6)-dimethyltransferase